MRTGSRRFPGARIKHADAVEHGGESVGIAGVPRVVEVVAQSWSSSDLGPDPPSELTDREGTLDADRVTEAQLVNTNGGALARKLHDATDVDLTFERATERGGQRQRG